MFHVFVFLMVYFWKIAELIGNIPSDLDNRSTTILFLFQGHNSQGLSKAG
ncbi:hypothetical protein ACVRXI_08795 [Streptococcus ovis]